MIQGEKVAWQKHGVPEPILGEFVHETGRRYWIRYPSPVNGEWRYALAGKDRVWSIEPFPCAGMAIANSTGDA